MIEDLFQEVETMGGSRSVNFEKGLHTFVRWLECRSKVRNKDETNHHE